MSLSDDMLDEILDEETEDYRIYVLKEIIRMAEKKGQTSLPLSLIKNLIHEGE